MKPMGTIAEQISVGLHRGNLGNLLRGLPRTRHWECSGVSREWLITPERDDHFDQTQVQLAAQRVSPGGDP